jgi:hypothetical protein
MARKDAKNAMRYFMIPQRREVHKEEIDGTQRREGKTLFYAPSLVEIAPSSRPQPYSPY